MQDLLAATCIHAGVMFAGNWIPDWREYQTQPERGQYDRQGNQWL